MVFCGVDEVAEIAYLSMQEAGIELVAVLDDAAAGEKFFGLPIMDVTQSTVSDTDIIVITSLKRAEEFLGKLLDLRGDRNRIYSPGCIDAPRSGRV